MSAPKQRVWKNNGDVKYDDDGARHVHHHHHYHHHYHIHHHHHYNEKEKVETITTDKLEEEEEEEDSGSNDFSKNYHNPPVQYDMSTPVKRQKGDKDKLSSMEFMSPWVFSPFDQEFLAEERRRNSLAAAELESERERKIVEEHWHNCNYDGAQPRDDFDLESSKQPVPVEAATFIEDAALLRTPVKETKETEVEAVAVQVNVAQNEKKPTPKAEQEENDEADTENTQYYYNMFLIQSTNKA